MTIHHGTLTEFERRLIPLRTLAGQAEAREHYAKEELPAGIDNELPLILQGYDAGYTAAMNRVRSLLNDLQTIAIRGGA